MGQRALCVDKFKVTDESGVVYNTTLKMYKSGAFQYGNQHCLVLRNETLKTEDLFDARYDTRFNTVESFHKNSFDFVSANVRSTCKVEKV